MTTSRVAIVTGAARGIGAAIADALAADGWSVAVCDVNLAAATATAAELRSNHRVAADGIGVDIADTASVRAAVAEVEAALGPVTALVNNAGIDVIKPFVDSTEDEWDRIIAVNLKGTIAFCRAVLDGMIQRNGGRIVSIASDAGRVGSSGEAVYSATKGGVIAFGKTLAREVARYGITVNSVCPGPTETALLAQVADYSEKLYAGLAKAIPLRRTAQPGDIAPAVAFLLSDGASYITGQSLSVSGGRTMA
ncbi:MAG: SDR family NAD(P)-dependent oxidoreductase [Actinomycetota bacterium]|nr:SDR family NAD(P)-dependent oxidoreductase [Actinomycetota bacterium]